MNYKVTTTPRVPNPGSPEAVDQGCECAILSNHNGKGFPWGPKNEICFWTNQDCPIHGAKEGQNAKRV